MIWVWIIAAVAISWLLCRKQGAWYHYIWMLLPIEMYGINIAGAMIKPYMIFGCFVIFSNMIKRNARKIPIGLFIIAFALVLSDILNGLIVASIMQHLMFILIIGIAYSYIKISEADEQILSSIECVTVATTIGYGLVFMLAFVMYTLQPQFGGVYCTDRYSAGIFLRFLSTGGDTAVRLRGFSIDPNVVVTTLIPGAAFSLERLIYRKEKKTTSLIAVLCYGAVVYLSGSRMAFLCTVAMLMAIIVSGYKQARNKGKWIIGIIALFFAVTVLVVQNYQELSVELYNFFNARSGLNDEAGRITIWKKNISWLGENGRLLFGVGQNQIANLTSIGKACHNTWLEWICGTGILIGSVMIGWFLIAPKYLIKNAKINGLEKIQYMPLLFAYLTTVICITTVDNITNSILIFLMILFRYGNLRAPYSNQYRAS